MPYRNKQMLRDANGDLIPQYWDVAAGDFKPLTGSGGANDTRLTGSIVEEVAVVDALALTDTSSSYHTINIGKYKKIKLYARSTVDSQIMLNIRPFTNTLNTTDFWDGEEWVTNDEITIPARRQTFILNSALPWLDDFIGTGDNFRVRVQALDTPTQGNISVYLLGQVR